MPAGQSSFPVPYVERALKCLLRTLREGDAGCRRAKPSNKGIRIACVEDPVDAKETCTIVRFQNNCDESDTKYKVIIVIVIAIIIIK